MNLSTAEQGNRGVSKASAMSVPLGILGFTSRLCLPAGGVLVVALAGVLVPRRLRSSAHGAVLAAHVFTMLAVEVTQMMYVTRLLPCMEAVPIQNFFTLSVACWLQSLCMNMVHRLRNNNIENIAENFIGFFLCMLYSWFAPFLTLLLIDAFVQDNSFGNATFLDSKTCIYTEGLINRNGEIDASIYLAISKGVLLLVSAVIFSYLGYNIGRHKRGIVLCIRDTGNLAAVIRRQQQAMRYVLLILGSYAIETTTDIGVWYTKHYQPRIHPEFPNQDLLAAERVFKSLSFCVDFIRCLLVCDVIWCRGPNRQNFQERPSQSQAAHRRFSNDSLPRYEEAIRQPVLSIEVLPPSYSSLFGPLFSQNDTVQNDSTCDTWDNDASSDCNNDSTHNNLNYYVCDTRSLCSNEIHFENTQCNTTTSDISGNASRTCDNASDRSRSENETFGQPNYNVTSFRTVTISDEVVEINVNSSSII